MFRLTRLTFLVPVCKPEQETYHFTLAQNSCAFEPISENTGQYENMPIFYFLIRNIYIKPISNIFSLIFLKQTKIYQTNCIFNSLYLNKVLIEERENFSIIYYVILFYKRVVILFIFSYFILFIIISFDVEYIKCG